MPKRGITKEIRAEVTKKIKEGKKVIEISEEYGISTQTIYRWLGSKATSGNEALEVSRLKRQNSELLRLVGQLTYQQELKKKGFNF